MNSGTFRSAGTPRGSPGSLGSVHIRRSRVRPWLRVDPELPAGTCWPDDAHRELLATPDVRELALPPGKGTAVTTLGSEGYRTLDPHQAFANTAQPGGDAGPGRDGETLGTYAGDWSQDRRVILSAPLTGRRHRAEIGRSRRTASRGDRQHKGEDENEEPFRHAETPPVHATS